ncbi:hypothetical protein ON010_g17919 [Phytophthora cinnamomi]|nr:hypothetical protein ON010_g17919 [Phytophthora cinnamomi]
MGSSSSKNKQQSSSGAAATSGAGANGVQVPGAPGHRGQPAARQRQAAAAGRQASAWSAGCQRVAAVTLHGLLNWWGLDCVRAGPREAGAEAQEVQGAADAPGRRALDPSAGHAGHGGVGDAAAAGLRRAQGGQLHPERYSQGDDGGGGRGAHAGDGRGTGNSECTTGRLIIGGSLTVEDEDAVLSELAEIEKLEAEALAAAIPEAPTAALETGTAKILT